MKDDEYCLDGILACSYEYGQDSNFGYAVHAYKGSGVPLNTAMKFPLQALAKIYLEKHIDCIENEFGPIEAIIPMAGRNGKNHVESLLVENPLADLPVINCLRDTYTGPGQSSGGQTTRFDPVRYQVEGRVPRRVILFDDVTTKGATGNSAAYALKSNGVRTVVLFCLAKHIQLQNLPDEVYNFDVNDCIFCIE